MVDVMSTFKTNAFIILQYLTPSTSFHVWLEASLLVKLAGLRISLLNVLRKIRHIIRRAQIQQFKNS